MKLPWKLKTVLAFAAVALATQSANAKDFGVQGKTWPIIEVDMRALMAESASKVDWSKVQNQLVQSAKGYVTNLPQNNLDGVSHTTTVWFDPSIKLTADIKVPIKQANGTYVWGVLYKKGTVVNPLASVRPVTAMFFFDGKDKDQVKLLKELLKLQPLKIVPVESGHGGIPELARATDRPIFYGSKQLLARFDITRLPTLMYPGSGSKSLYLGETTYAKPYVAEQVLQTWPYLLPTTKVKQ
jgi:conjugal transfer pilus assembly protein TraW